MSYIDTRMFVCMYVYTYMSWAPRRSRNCELTAFTYFILFIESFIYLFIQIPARHGHQGDPATVSLLRLPWLLCLCVQQEKKNPKKNPQKTHCEPTAFIMAAFCVLIERGGELFSQ